MIWFVALGGAAGSVARYLLGALVQQRAGVTFPLGTLFVNVTGSFLAGLLLRFGLASPSMSPEIRTLLTTGFCGGYTTFSTFSYETIGLLEEGQYWRSSIYIVASVAISLLGAYLGITLAREVLALRHRA
jgi:CrcB protein